MDAVATGHLIRPLTWSWNWWPLTGMLLFAVLARFVMRAPMRVWMLIPALVAGEIFSIAVRHTGVLPTTALAVLLAAIGSLVVHRSRVR